MHISKIRIFHYKAFYDSKWINFEPGINIISGQNHSGKTALLEALSLNFENIPHKSLKTIPNQFKTLLKDSDLSISIKLNNHDLKPLIDENLSHFLFPFPISGNNQSLRRIVDCILQKMNNLDDLEITIPLDHQGINFKDFPKVKEDYFKTFTFDCYQPQYPPEKFSGKFLFRVVQLDLKNRTNNSATQLQKYEDLFALKPFFKIKRETYRFYAERMNVGICKFGDRRDLEPDASNLAEVLNCLQGNPSKFNKFNQLVSIVLPHIKRITIQPRENGIEIMVWSIDPNTEREDLAIPLSASGTGVSQVLAILYVVFTSQEPRTIIIDEPQSFLHPGAARKLIEILKDFPQHQYFISTHSPGIISAANPSTITLLKYKDCEAKPYAMSSEENSDMRSLLDEVGVHLSDVFGSDNILWVEGPTEERCFPLILKKIAKHNLEGTQILAIKNTGDLEGKKAHIIFDVYDRLSGGKNLLPPAIGFILDRENKTQQKMKDLSKRSENKVHFLNRRMYENYLLVPEAIATIANQQDGFRGEPLTIEEVENRIEKSKQDKKLYPRNFRNFEDNNLCRQKVDGAKLLIKLFAEFSENRVNYVKTKHSFELTEWLVQNKPEQLSELADLLKTILTQTK